MSLESSAKARYQPPTSEDTPEIPAKVDNGLKFTESYSIYLKVLKDKNLRAAFAAARPGLTQSWLKKELKNATAKNLDVYRESLCSKSQIEEIIEKVQAHAKQPGNAKPDAEFIEKEFREHPELLEFFVEYALDQRMLEFEFDERRAHAEIEHIMNAHNNGWNDYEILGIKKPMTRDEVQKRCREILFLVHPDKNKDEHAKHCTQIINNVKDRVLGENSKVYKPPKGQRNNRQDDEEQFAPGAFGSEIEDDDEDDDENDGAVKNPDEEIPDVPDDVKQAHKLVGKFILPYLSTFVNPTPPVPDAVRKGNNMISRLNADAKRNPEWYHVGRGIIYEFHKQQMRIIESRNTMDAEALEKRVRMFRQEYLKTSRKRAHQWPESWGAAIEKTLRSELDKQANKNHAGTLPNNVDIDMDRKADDANIDTDSDTDMDLNANENSSQIDSSYGVRGNVAETAVRPIKTLRPGYTLLGDKILGCRLLRRFSVWENKPITYNVKFFVENADSKIFNVFSGAEIGYQPAIAHGNLDKMEMNDVEIHLENVRTSKLTANMFDKILGVCAKESQHEMTDRFPETWVHIAVKEEVDIDIQIDIDNSKPIIIHRTAFRQLIDHADKRIDSFYMDQGIEPPWSTTRYPDPKNRVRYMPLLYPAPRRKARQYSERRMVMSSPTY